MTATITQLQARAEALAADIREAENAVRKQGFQGVPYILAEVGKDVENATRGLRLAAWQRQQDEALDATLQARSLEAQAA